MERSSGGGVVEPVGYWQTRGYGATRAQVVEAAAAHGLPPEMVREFAGGSTHWDAATGEWVARSGGSVEETLIVCLGGNLHAYREARAVGCTHAECVEVAALGVDLVRYRYARMGGAVHAQVVDAVTVQGLSAGLVVEFAERVAGRSDADLRTIVFEVMAGVG